MLGLNRNTLRALRRDPVDAHKHPSTIFTSSSPPYFYIFMQLLSRLVFEGNRKKSCKKGIIPHLEFDLGWSVNYSFNYSLLHGGLRKSALSLIIFRCLITRETRSVIGNYRSAWICGIVFESIVYILLLLFFFSLNRTIIIMDIPVILNRRVDDDLFDSTFFFFLFIPIDWMTHRNYCTLERNKRRPLRLSYV